VSRGLSTFENRLGPSLIPRTPHSPHPHPSSPPHPIFASVFPEQAETELLKEEYMRENQTHLLLQVCSPMSARCVVDPEPLNLCICFIDVCNRCIYLIHEHRAHVLDSRTQLCTRSARSTWFIIFTSHLIHHVHNSAFRAARLCYSTRPRCSCAMFPPPSLAPSRGRFRPPPSLCRRR
jgi:hypothetical protein